MGVKIAKGLGVGTALVLVLAGLGAIAGPRFSPRPVTDAPVLETSDTAIGSDAVTTPVGTYEVHSEFRSIEVAEGVTVTARIRTPIGAPDGLPAVVFLHGAGTADYLGFPQQAEALASAGIVTVVPDKRMDTYTLTHRDYVASAADYHVSVDVAQELPGVDPDRVGIYAESEGAYIAPVMAAEYDDVAFVALVSAPVVPGRQQGAYAATTYLQNTGVPDSVFRAIPRAAGSEIPFGWFGYADFDPQPYQQRMTQPLFIAYGTGDASMPAAEGTVQLFTDLAVAGNDQVTARFYDGANHGLKMGGIYGPLADGFADDLARWINGLPETARAAPHVAGATPNQPISAEPGPAAPWYQSGTVLVGSFAASAGLLVVGVGAAAVAAIRRTMPAGLGVRLLGAAGLTLLTWGAYGYYLRRTASLAFGYLSDTGFTYGFLPVVHALGAAATVLLGAAITHWWDAGRIGTRRKGSGTAVVALLGGGTLALLALGSYWGALPNPFG